MIDVEEDQNLATIVLEERVIRDNDYRLHGIQLQFANGDESTFYRGMKTGQEANTIELELDQDRRIAGIQMKQFKDRLTGIAILDDDGEIMVKHDV